MFKIHSKLVILASLGGALEFLDFTIYALFARYISQNFFPMEENLTALLNTFAIFAIGYLARPLGGIIFGHFGDRYGRKNTFTISAFLMAFSTLMMGCLPTYAQIGIAAPLLLLVFRLLQGVSVGGEVPGATVFISEHYPAAHRGFAVSLIFMAVTLGNVIGSGMGYILTRTLSNSMMLEWGWRIPFIIGSGLAAIAYILRRKASETPVFTAMVQAEGVHRLPIFKIIQKNSLQFIAAIGLTALSASTIFIFLYLPTYPFVANHHSVTFLYLLTIISFLSLSFFTAVFGFISDYYSRKKLIMLSAIATLIIGYFIFKYALLTYTDIQLLFFCVLLGALIGIANGCYGCAIAFLFPAKNRYSGMGGAYNLGYAIFGGLSPLLVTALLKWTQSPFSLYYLLVIAAIITFLSTLALKTRDF